MQDQYLTYDPVDLAADDSFIGWVKQGQPNESLWATWIQEHPEKRSDIEEAIDLVQLIKINEGAPPKINTTDIWNRINNSIEAEGQNQSTGAQVVTMPRRSAFRFIAYAAAACMAALLVFQLFNNSDQIIYAEYGKQISHVLPDDSEIELNADSEITYDEANWTTERKLALKGEAYFKVEKGQKFSVHTDHGIISVLGTSFNIYSRPDGFRVHCTSGRVQVKSNNETVLLTPGTKTSLNDAGLLIKENLTPDSQVDWLGKVYRFNKIPLEVVFQSVERQFDVEITLDAGIGERLFTGSFEATELEKALNIICYPMQLSPIIQGKKIRIQSDVGN